MPKGPKGEKRPGDVRGFALHGSPPAVAAGVPDTHYDIEWIVGLIDQRGPKPGPRANW